MPVYKHMESYRRYFPLWYEKLCDGSHDGYAISWDVKIRVAPTWEQVWQHVVTDNFLCESEAILHFGDIRALGERYNDALADGNASLWDMCTENMRTNVTDDDTWRTCSPRTYKRWGVRNDRLYNVTYRFSGRSGGHLVIEQFESSHMHRESVQDITEWTGENIRGLLCLMDEVKQMVDKRDEEFVYQLAWNFYHNVLKED
jgi:hypothetical protein